MLLIAMGLPVLLSSMTNRAERLAQPLEAEGRRGEHNLTAGLGLINKQQLGLIT